MKKVMVLMTWCTLLYAPYAPLKTRALFSLWQTAPEPKKDVLIEAIKKTELSDVQRLFVRAYITTRRQSRQDDVMLNTSFRTALLTTVITDHATFNPDSVVEVYFGDTVQKMHILAPVWHAGDTPVIAVALAKIGRYNPQRAHELRALYAPGLPIAAVLPTTDLLSLDDCGENKNDYEEIP